jgi:hypothetical protein
VFLFAFGDVLCMVLVKGWVITKNKMTVNVDTPGPDPCAFIIRHGDGRKGGGVGVGIRPLSIWRQTQGGASPRGGAYP